MNNVLPPYGLRAYRVMGMGRYFQGTDTRTLPVTLPPGVVLAKPDRVLNCDASRLTLMQRGLNFEHPHLG